MKKTSEVVYTKPARLPLGIVDYTRMLASVKVTFLLNN